MIKIDAEFDLELLKEHFVESDGYDRETILNELLAWQATDKFFCLVVMDGESITGFVCGYICRNSLFISESWHSPGSPITEAKEAFEMIKDWARVRGLVAIYGETQRKQMKAMERFGFVQHSINMVCKLG